jgi:hypothetical protein
MTEIGSLVVSGRASLDLDLSKQYRETIAEYIAIKSFVRAKDIYFLA